MEFTGPHVWHWLSVRCELQIAWGVQTQGSMRNTSRRSEVKIHLKGNLQMNFQLKTPTDQIYRLAFHWEHEFCQTSILELVVLLKFVIPPWRGEHVHLVTVLTPSCVVYGLFPKLTAINHLINFQFFMCFQGKYKSNMFRWKNFDVDYCLSEEVTVYFIVGPNCND